MYLRLLRLPGVGRLVLASVIGGISVTMNVAAQVLLVQQATGSFATTGVVAGTNAVAGALSAPLLGRLVDRVGQTRVLVPAVAVYAVALWGLVAAAQGHAPVLVLCLAAAMAGAGNPPISACRRALWPRLVAGSDVPLATAFAADSVIVEVLFIVGPLLAGLLIVVASPAAAVLAASGLALLGNWSFAAAPESRAWRPEHPETRSWAGALRKPGIRVIVAALVPFGAAFGALDIALPAFAVAHHAPAATGVLWAVQAMGSAAGGLWYGARTRRRALPRRWLELSVVFALGLAPLALAGSLPVLCILIAVSGLALAPATAAAFELTGHLAPLGTSTEAFTWAVTANVGGSAAGAAIAGGIVQAHGTSAGFVLACALALAGAALAVAFRRALGPDVVY